MIVVPANPNIVQIPIIQTGCMKSEYDSTYPVHLNGILRQDEFEQSIRNINQTILSRQPSIICGLLGIICLIGGFILAIAGGIPTGTSRTSGLEVLVAVGCIGMFLGVMVLSVGCCIIRSRRVIRMQEAVANESRKYSTRSPTPCSWRLNSTRIWTRGYGNRGFSTIYRIIIEIGQPVVPGNGNILYQFNQQSIQPKSFFSQQNNMSPPPPYDSHSVGRFCSQCGMPQQNSTAKFCSSCGQPLNV